MYYKDVERNKDFVYLDTFVWDTNKNELNKINHKIDFETACRIFNDPCLYYEYDKGHSEIAGEHRVKNLGLLNGIVVVAVWAVDLDNGLKRIFTARKANRQEVKIYEYHAKKLQGY